MLLSDINLFTNTALEDRDLIFNSPHLIFLFCSIVAVVLIVIGLLSIAHLLFTFDLTDLSQGTDTVLIRL